LSVYRSFLFAPGNHTRRVEKCLGLPTDAVILDLEDAVAVAEKPATRALIVEALGQPRRSLGYVRVNAFDTPFCFGDVHEVVGPNLDGIVLPKVESAAQLIAVDWMIGQLERDRGLVEGSIDLMPIIETGAGLTAINEICTARTRIRRVAFGAGDYTLDMGMRWSRSESELEQARHAFVLASRAAGLEPPVDTVWIHLGEIDAVTRSAERARDLGFQGKMCIHPEQIDPVNSTFTPSAEEVEQSKRYVLAFDEAEANGLASIQVDGYFIDYPIVEKARRVVAMSEAIESAGAEA
jgi:citrate lyase subunit beta/citryl-CoA lyase